MTGLVADPAPEVRPDRPAEKPARPYFSSGPCAKPPGWALERLPHGSLGRSHRSKLGKSRLSHAIDLTREVLQVPDTHRIGIVPASDTGAVEMAMWSMLGARPVTLLAWESFGEGWVTDAVKQLKIDPKVMKAPYGALPDLSSVPDPAASRKRIVLTGDVPSPANPPSGCVFHPRCHHPQKDAACQRIVPPLEEKAPGHWAACIKQPPTGVEWAAQQAAGGTRQPQRYLPMAALHRRAE